MAMTFLQVWCEGARIFMNPLGRNFNLQRANKVGDSTVVDGYVM